MLRTGIIVAVVLTAGVAGLLVYKSKKPAKEVEPQSWALPASAGVKVLTNLGAAQDHLPEGLRGKEASRAKDENIPVARIGEIAVVGNVQTDAKAVLDHVDLRPGKILFYSDLRAAEQSLAKTGLFVVDTARGIRPTIEAQDVEGSWYKKIVIHVQEK